MGLLQQADEEISQDPAEEQETPEAPEAEAQPENGEPPRRQPSRRDKKIADLEKTFGERFQQYDQRLSERERELAELRERHARAEGELEAMRRMPQQPQRQEPQEDPEELRRKAEEALSQQNFSEFRRLDRRANEVERDQWWRQREASLREEWQKNQPQAVDPYVQTLVARHEHVAEHPNGGNLVRAALANIKLWNPSQDHNSALAQAFREVNDRLGAAKKNGKPQQSTYDRSSAPVLSGVTPGRSAGDGDDEAPQLTPQEAQIAKEWGLSAKAYQLYRSDPQKAAKLYPKK